MQIFNAHLIEDRNYRPLFGNKQTILLHGVLLRKEIGFGLGVSREALVSDSIFERWSNSKFSLQFAVGG